jgi:hypothetical protein
MTDLEKLINALCELPTVTLEGIGDVEVLWKKQGGQIFLLLDEGCDSVGLDPTQALALMDWLKEQRENLETLQEALRAKQVEDEATKEQREAERINALKALHSEAVTAWQEDGCIGPCPRFEDIVFKEQFVRVELFEESAEAPMFVKQYPMLERLRKEKQG